MANQFNKNAKLAMKSAMKDMEVAGMKPNNIRIIEERLGIKFSMVNFHREVKNEYSL